MTSKRGKKINLSCNCSDRMKSIMLVLLIILAALLAYIAFSMLYLPEQ